jgi:uncharacterized lipoprotein NlpE involved in copper resistance
MQPYGAPAGRVHVVLALVLALGACRSAERPVNGASSTPVAKQSTNAFVVGRYAGTLPCADCRGIRTTVALYARDRLQTGDGTFDLSEEFLGTRDGDRRFDARGRWIVLRGTPTDVDATVYQLTVNQAKRVLYFLRVGDDALRLLDNQQREIRSPGNHALARVSDAPVGGLPRGCDSDGPTRSRVTRVVMSR